MSTLHGHILTPSKAPPGSPSSSWYFINHGTLCHFIDRSYLKVALEVTYLNPVWSHAGICLPVYIGHSGAAIVQVQSIFSEGLILNTTEYTETNTFRIYIRWNALRNTHWLKHNENIHTHAETIIYTGWYQFRIYTRWNILRMYTCWNTIWMYSGWNIQNIHRHSTERHSMFPIRCFALLDALGNLNRISFSFIAWKLSDVAVHQHSLV